MLNTHSPNLQFIEQLVQLSNMVCAQIYF